jgi:hypothetical protein
MAKRYEAAKAPRFEIERGVGGERIRVPARRNWPAMLFLPVWLIGWTIGGIAAIVELLRTGEPFLALWLVGWAVGWLGAAGVVAWMGWGAEILRVSGGDLELGESLFGWTRARLYRGGDVRNLSASGMPFFAHLQVRLPFMMRARWGSVKFNYGARTIYAAQGLDEAEGQLIVEWLRRRLPSLASDNPPTADDPDRR